VVTASITRKGPVLTFSGALTRAAVPSLWTAAQPLLDGVTQLDLSAVGQIDSGGLALLVELTTRAQLTINGAPPGLGELRAAYRLTPALRFT